MKTAQFAAAKLHRILCHPFGRTCARGVPEKIEMCFQKDRVTQKLIYDDIWEVYTLISRKYFNHASQIQLDHAINEMSIEARNWSITFSQLSAG